MDCPRELDLLIRARYPIIYLRSSEEARACNLISIIAKAEKKGLVEWSSTEGLRRVEDFQGSSADGLRKTEDLQGSATPPAGDALRQPLAALEAILQDAGRTIYLMKDLHSFLDDRAVIRKIRDLYASLKRSYKTIVILAPYKKIPLDLEKDIYFLDMPLPDLDGLKKLLQEIGDTLHGDARVRIELTGPVLDRMANAALGLTLEEAERVFFKAVIRDAKLAGDEVQFVREEKRQIVEKSGLLEYYETTTDMNSVGGLDLLKAWLQRRGRAFQPAARDYGLPPPKGLLLLGVQGCGKSLAAKAVSGAWGFPLLRLDMSRIFGSLIGSSEENMRRALEMAESVSPTVLWVDEIEKTFSGIESSGMSDAGTTARVFGYFLTWLQDNTAPVFCVATANSIERLPPELLRKGRFDDIFFVDLPNARERMEIARIHLAKRKRDPEKFNLTNLAAQSEAFSGAEIEQAILSAMYDAFDANREVVQADILESMQSAVPLSVTMREEIDRVRQWAKDRARPASSK
jgi:SpoVK/Ycf46/Vps4 family AAA+-type ATPase